MKNFTHIIKLMIGGLLASTTLSAQTLIYSENFNNEETAGKWIASAKPTQWNASGEQNGWKYDNCSIIPDQKALNDGSAGIIVLNHTGAASLEFPAAPSGGIGNAVIVAQFQPSGKEHTVGPDGDCDSDILLQKNINDEWITIHTISAKNIQASKAYKYVLPVDDANVNSLRLVYTSNPEGGARARIYDVALYRMSVKAAEWSDASDISDNTFTLNWHPALLAESYEVVVAKRTQTENTELVTERGAESESSAWTTEGAVTRSEEKAATGKFSWKLDGTDQLARVWQNIPVEAGTSLNISLKGWVAANSTTDKEMRLWGQFLREDGSVALAAPHLSGNDAYKTVSTDWVPMSVTDLIVPEDAVSMDLDFRTQPGVVAYADDFSVIGTAVERIPVAEKPFTTADTSLKIENLEPGQEYSVYVYSVAADNKAKSKELIVKTTGTANAIGETDSEQLQVINHSTGIRIKGIQQTSRIEVYTITGQLSGTYVTTEQEINIPLSTGAYLIKIDRKIVKVIR